MSELSALGKFLFAHPACFDCQPELLSAVRIGDHFTFLQHLHNALVFSEARFRPVESFWPFRPLLHSFILEPNLPEGDWLNTPHADNLPMSERTR